jgi:guanylate kinase
MEKRVLIIAGPTGVGESTITNQIIERYQNFTRLVTATTRAPRLNEKNQIDYYFFSNQEFEKAIQNGQILEYQNTRNGQVYYGTYKPDLEEKLQKGFNIIVNTDIIGMNFYKKNYNATTIFIAPDSIENLKKRHAVRGSDSPEEQEKRLAYAQYEIEKEGPFYDYTVINKQDKLAEALENVINILKIEGYILN